VNIANFVLGLDRDSIPFLQLIQQIIKNNSKYVLCLRIFRQTNVAVCIRLQWHDYRFLYVGLYAQNIWLELKMHKS